MDNKFEDIDALLNGIFDEKPLRHLFDKRLHELGINQTSAQKLLKIERRTLNGILDGTQKRANFEAFHKLAVFLNISTEELITEHLSFLEKKYIDKNSPTNKKKFIRENFDLVVLKKAGFIKDISDFDAIEKRITSYFGYNSIFEYKKRNFNIAFSAAATIPKKTETRELWLASAKSIAAKLNNPYFYDREQLKKYFAQIRWNSTNVEFGLINVIKSLFKLGITVIFQPSFSSLHLRGATFAVEGQPCIILTNYRGFYPTLWHCLVHELYHVLFDFEELKNNTDFMLTEDTNEVLTIDPKEIEADDFASEYFFSKSKLEEVSPYMRDEEYIEEVAHNNNIHPSLIYIYYAYKNGSDDRKAWARARRFMPDINMALNRIEIPWENVVSVDETAKKLKLEIYN